MKNMGNQPMVLVEPRRSPRSTGKCASPPGAPIYTERPEWSATSWKSPGRLCVVMGTSARDRRNTLARGLIRVRLPTSAWISFASCLTQVALVLRRETPG